MDPAFIAGFGVIAGGVVVSAAAIVATVASKFQKVPAGIFALAGGVAPWLHFAMMKRWIPSSNLLSAINIFGAGPLFLIAFFLYGLGARAPKREVAARACLVGMFAGLGYSVFLWNLLARIP